jgi:hypothetical protein
VDIYFTATAAGTFTESIIDWVSQTSGFSNPSSSVEMANTSTAEFKHLRANPPKDSIALMWHESDDNTSILKLTAPVSSIVDITMEYVMNDSDALVVGPTLSGATLGTIYHKQPTANMSVVGNLNTIA